MRVEGRVTALLLGTAVAALGLLACVEAQPPASEGGECCIFTGPVPHDCAAIESLGPGADLDGRCNAVNQGQSCSWVYSKEVCCEIAKKDGFGDVTCGRSGDCCLFTGPMAHDCAAIESLGPGADLDGRCNAVNQGQSCSWSYGDEVCCQTAIDDGFPGSVQCN